MLSNRKLRKQTAKFRRSERRRINAIVYEARDADISERKKQAAEHAVRLEGNWNGDLS